MYHFFHYQFKKISFVRFSVLKVLRFWFCWWFCALTILDKFRWKFLSIFDKCIFDFNFQTSGKFLAICISDLRIIMVSKLVKANLLTILLYSQRLCIVFHSPSIVVFNGARTLPKKVHFFFTKKRLKSTPY